MGGNSSPAFSASVLPFSLIWASIKLVASSV